MKKTLFVVLTIFAVLLVVLIAVPFVFKDKILERVDKEIAGAVNAQVFYDYDNISLSVFKSFPSISATIEEFGIKGNPPFQNDTLLHVNQLQVDLNLKSVIFDDTPELTGVHLNGGSIYVKVLEDGTANYDIAVEAAEESNHNSSEFNLGVNLIEISDLNLIYDDRQMQFFVALADLYMRGSGDFSSEIYDLLAKADVNIVRLDYEDTNYLNNKNLGLDTRINVDLGKMVFGIEEADISLNDFYFGVDGYMAMPADDMEFDMTFAGKENSFKSILSLVPGIFTESFDGLETSGTMDFQGFLKGSYNENSFPAFEVGLVVEEGMFQYPDLPKPVSDVNINMLVKNETNNLDNTQINISDFELNFGSNPISGRLLLENLVTYDLNGQLMGRLNLEELTSIFPIEGMELKGSLNVNATADGRYDSVANTIPHIDAVMVLNNGYIKSTEYPAPIENLNINLTAINNTGRMNDLLVDLSSFGFDLEGESIKGNLKVNDLDRLNWDGEIFGTMDLGKVATIFPMEDVILEGRIVVGIDSKGNYEDVEASRYNRLEAKGNIELTDFYYADINLPQGIRIRSARGDFSPDAINLTDFNARLGESPLTATGSLTNYLAYLFGENEVLQGNLNLYSSKFNVNEWMTGTSEIEDTTELSVIELPRDIDFTMAVKADEVLYDNLTLSEVNGSMTLKDGILSFNNATMNTLGGKMALDGSYNSQDISSPTFDMTFDVSSISIQEAFKSFNTVRAFAPIAQHVTGNFTTKFGLSGMLGPDMMPVLPSLDGNGLIKVTEAALRDSKILEGITSLTKLEDTKSINFRNLNISAEIADGMLQLRPFDVSLWGYEAEVQGSTGFDGSINYLVNMEVPVEKFGTQANNLLSNLTKTDLSTTTIPLAFNLQGNYANPKISLVGGDNIEGYVTNVLKSRVSSVTTQVQEDLAAEFKAKEDSLKQELRTKAEVAKDSAKMEAEKIINQTKDKAVDELKGLLKGFGRKSKAKPDTVQ
ncbi:MAG: AsmA-like C-terminal region-containing protein [Anditalea sp.]